MSTFSRRLFFLAIPGALGVCLGFNFSARNTTRDSNQGIKEVYDEKRASKYLSSGNRNDKEQRSPSLHNDVSIIRLISNPVDFHEKPVRAKGLLRIRYEEHAIYLTKEHSDYGIASNAIWLDFSAFIKEGRLEEIRSLDQKWALVEGIFDKSEKGHSGAFAGAIHEIWRVQEIPPEPRGLQRNPAK